MKVGVEVEYWVVDETGRLCSGAEIVDRHDGVVPEFIDPLIEIQTAPHEDVTALRRDLFQTLRAVWADAAAQGKHLVPLGTPLTTTAMSAVSSRGRLLEQIYGERLTAAKHCAGTHIHFDTENVADQLNLLIALDPAIALVNSSPYYAGTHLGQSSRAKMYRCTGDSEMAPYRDLWQYTDSVEEWTQRIDTRYEAFRTLAEQQGITSSAFETWFRPEDSILAPVRLRHQPPTVEWRAPDTALPSQIMQLVRDVTWLLRQSDQIPVEIGTPGVSLEYIGIPLFDELRWLTAEAITHGLRSAAVREYLEQLRFDTTQYQPLAARLPTRQQISDHDARQFRLAAAEMLCDDIDTLGTGENTPTPEPTQVAADGHPDW
jgi:gamma-glutamyl:cysteine ligase YbdK (ATP-grasp superfamily)